MFEQQMHLKRGSGKVKVNFSHGLTNPVTAELDKNDLHGLKLGDLSMQVLNENISHPDLIVRKMAQSGKHVLSNPFSDIEVCFDGSDKAVNVSRHDFNDKVEDIMKESGKTVDQVQEINIRASKRVSGGCQ